MKDTLLSCLIMFRIAWAHSRGKLIFSTIATLASGASWPLLALALKGATEAALAHDTRGALLYGAFIGVGAISVLMLQHFAYLPYTEIAERAEITLEAELMTLANGSARLDHHERPDYADKFELLRKEIGEIAPGFTGLFNTLGLLVSMSVTAVLLAGVNPWLLLLPIAAIPPVLTGQRSQRLLATSREKSASTTRQAWHLFHLATRAAPAKELRVFRLQDEIRRRQRALWKSSGVVLWTAVKRAAVLIAAGQLVFAVAYVVAVLLVVRQAATGVSRIGDVVLVMTLAAQVNQQVSTGLQLLQQLQRMAQSLTRLRWMRALVESQEPPAADTPMPRPHRARHRAARRLGFAYPGTDKLVLSDVDLLLPAGTTVAVVGENGAGKTTLIKLLCRFYEATAGHDHRGRRRHPALPARRVAAADRRRLPGLRPLRARRAADGRRRRSAGAGRRGGRAGRAGACARRRHGRPAGRRPADAARQELRRRRRTVRWPMAEARARAER